METLRQFFLKYGGWSVWLFIIGIPPQIIQNFGTHTYASGTLTSWTLFATAYFLFGTYALTKKDLPVMAGQYTGGVLCLIVILQSFLYVHAR